MPQSQSLSTSEEQSLRFGRYELQPRERRLLADGSPIALGGRAFDLLATLAAQPGRLLTKGDLLDLVWPGLVVEESNLHTQVSSLRRALGNKCVGTFDRMPAHTPRAAVIDAADQAREARADLIVTLGGGSITDGAKAVQLCLANDIRTPEAMDRIRAPSPLKPPAQRRLVSPQDFAERR